ncbi:TIGR03086 family metal-binding protein [Saccharopolyspora taberi]|uniref:TIGR03086 family metal-binding protein n=1 Tax=Saccharopolyspora taberi TaxID=60895 RepID=A0ABN3VDI2_9PSEU
MDIRHLHQRAAADVWRVVSRIRPDQLHLPTPCADWTLHGLLRHLVSENLGFAAAATGKSDVDRNAVDRDAVDWDAVDWDAGRLGDSPAEDYRRSAEEFDRAFADDGVLASRMRVREFGVLPGSTALAMHFIDLVVHGWDVARTIGADYRPDDELPSTALRLMRGFSGGQAARVFGPPVAVDGSAGALDQLVAFLGRSPGWNGGGVG